MKKLVHHESKSRPYSDNDIADALHFIGVNVSRRTVSKYRSILDIPTSVARTQAYRLERGSSCFFQK
jgi:RNA polymerase sigma-54 factor